MLLMPESFRQSLLIFGKFNVGFEKLVWVSKIYWYSMVLSGLELGKIWLGVGLIQFKDLDW